MAIFGNKPLKGKIAIVTGGTKGIGLAIADKLKADGATVIVCARNPEKREKHPAIAVDVSDRVDVQTMVDYVLRKYKKIDILVNNAGVFPSVEFKDMTEKQWDDLMAINLKGVFNCTKAVLPHMMNKKYGKIINISSIASIQGYAGLVHYCTSKAGVAGFTRALAIEMASHNIAVNAIAPGLISTPGANVLMNPEAQNTFAASIPIKRIGQPKDIAEVAAFLASDASNNIIGQVIVSDGGSSIQ